MKLKKLIAGLLGAAMLTVGLAGCGGGGDKDAAKPAGNDENKVVIYCPHPLAFINPLVEEFEKESGVKVEVVAAGTGELLKRVESEKANPLADIFWGGSLSTVKPKAALFEEYRSINEDHIQKDFKNVEGSITRFTDIPSVIMINTNLIGDVKVEGYEDLLNP
ncbi:MAG TPA: ABC transporter substrate-binding protein, partial [Anaerovibrio sp.]|nr:ABC transporter substrate-binding protein [Anaerovibrio sp.]